MRFYSLLGTGQVNCRYCRHMAPRETTGACSVCGAAGPAAPTERAESVIDTLERNVFITLGQQAGLGHMKDLFRAMAAR